MRGSDYVVKRVLFAIGTVFVAVTLNFVLFRSLSGDAVSALRCRTCTQDFKEFQRRELGLDKSKWEQYQIYLVDLAHGDMWLHGPRRSRFGQVSASNVRKVLFLYPSAQPPTSIVGQAIRSYPGRSEPWRQ